MASYICGFINPKTNPYTVVEAESWSEDVYAYEGYSWDRYDELPPYGCKGKLDYQGRYWFFAYSGDPNNPTAIYLCRANYNQSTNAIDIAYVQVPLVNEQYVPRPNQLTVDRYGNVFFPAGKCSAGYGSPESAAFVYSVDATSDDPDNWVFTINQITIQSGRGSMSGAIGIALNRTHTKLMTYVAGVPGTPTEYDKIIVFDNNFNGSITYNTTELLNTAYEDFTQFPDNIETDVSGGPNDGYSYFVLELDTIVAYNMDTDAIVSTHVDYCGNRIAVRNDGRLLTTFPYTYGDFEVLQFVPDGGVGGAVLYETTFTITGNGRPLQVAEYVSDETTLVPVVTGLPSESTPEQGEVQEAVDDEQMYQREDYRYPSVATPRERYYEPEPPS